MNDIPDTGYQVLARKYRPATFADLVGQDAMVRTLKNAFETARIAQAFIMTGIRGTGKTTTARIIAKGMNCIGEDGKGGPTTEPCGICEHCVSIAEGRHVDVLEMDAASRPGEGDIRAEMIRRDIVDCIVSLPGQLFYTTQIPVCLWFLARDKSNGILKDKRLRDRRGETLFIDARALGHMETRTLKVLTSPNDVGKGQDSAIGKIVAAYHAWREGRADYEDVLGFCKAVKNEEIEAQGFVLTPGRFVGAAKVEEDDTPFIERLGTLTAMLKEQQAETMRLNQKVAKVLKCLSVDG